MVGSLHSKLISVVIFPISVNSAMSKASAALRRGGVRIRSIGSGHTHLKLLISDQSSTRQRYKDLLSTQASSSLRLDRWAQAEESPAVQDVLHQVHDLNLMWVEAQREFVVALKEYKRVYENILAVEKKLDIARKHLATCEEKEKKLKKELVKGPKDVALVQEKLKLVSDSVHLADAEVSGQTRETEAVKLISVRAGLLDMSQAWESLGRRCTLLSESQRELAHLIPDIGSSRVQEVPPYNGSRDTTRIMMATRSKFDQLESPAFTSGSSSSLQGATNSTSSFKSHSSSTNHSSSTYQSSRSSSYQSRTSSARSRDGSRDSDTTLTRRNMEMLGTIDPEDADNSFDEDSYDDSDG